MLAYWKANGFRAQVHPATLFMRRDLVLALGGWMALPASEDTGLLLALSATSRGWFSSEVGLHYRKWPGQATSQASHTETAERAARMAVVEARARELARLNWGIRGGLRSPQGSVSASTREKIRSLSSTTGCRHRTGTPPDRRIAAG